jgi:hypothetical protein
MSHDRCWFCCWLSHVRVVTSLPPSSSLGRLTLHSTANSCQWPYGSKKKPANYWQQGQRGDANRVRDASRAQVCFFLLCTSKLLLTIGCREQVRRRHCHTVERPPSSPSSRLGRTGCQPEDGTLTGARDADASRAQVYFLSSFLSSAVSLLIDYTACSEREWSLAATATHHQVGKTRGSRRGATCIAS